jgi:hypothetical protein
MIRFLCSHCQADLETDPELAGQLVRCPYCQMPMLAPLSSAPAPENTDQLRLRKVLRRKPTQRLALTVLGALALTALFFVLVLHLPRRTGDQPDLLSAKSITLLHDLMPSGEAGDLARHPWFKGASADQLDTFVTELTRSGPAIYALDKDGAYEILVRAEGVPDFELHDAKLSRDRTRGRLLVLLRTRHDGLYERQEIIAMLKQLLDASYLETPPDGQ